MDLHIYSLLVQYYLFQLLHIISGDYLYLNKHHKLIFVDLPEQEALVVDPIAMKQILARL